MSRFEPVHLDEPLGRRVSQTMLKHYNSCPRAGFLYAKYRRAGVQTVPMVRGSAVHAVKERATRAMLEAGERMIPPELVKAIVTEALVEFAVPIEEHDFIREEAHRWASEWQLFADERVVGLETLFVLEVAGWDVRCKVDFASVRQAEGGGLRVHIEDYKSGRGVPPFDEISRKRRDGTIAAKNLQLILYVLAVVFGRPSRACEGCGGRGRVPMAALTGDEQHQAAVACIDCGGSGAVLGEQVARGCEEADAEFVFPGVENAEGLMMRRPVTLTRLEMLEYLESLETIVRRLAESERTGDWPAVASEKACAECPARKECPIPETLRDFLGEINEPAHAAEALQLRLVRQQRDRALGREIRAFVKAQPGSRVVYGDRVAELAPTRKEEIRDKDGFYAALAAGRSLEDARDEFVRVSEGTTFVDRELGEDEREERAA